MAPSIPLPFLDKKRAQHIAVLPVTSATYATWLKKQPAPIQKALENAGFEGKPGQNAVWYDKNGQIGGVLAGVHAPVKLYDFANVADYIARTLPAATLKKASFSIEGLGKGDAEHAHLGWGLAAYRFDRYKKSARVVPQLVGKPSARVTAILHSTFLLRDLVNTPSNDMGPQELAKAAQDVAANFDTKIRIIKDKDLLKENFPMVFAVGDSSDRRPCLIDFTWGNPKNPKLTLVGKGVCFDTGGLDIKPSSAMLLMKKDMGGAAHALALAHVVMALKLPVRLRVIIPAVENAISGKAFRPGDIFTSRKGLSIENTNTDAEGRLILSDALTLASEDKPDLIIDFATLTGSARAGLGPDIPALFSNNPKVAEKIEKISLQVDDPVWSMPLWQPYRKYIESPVADLVNSAGTPGDLIFSALFLESFLVGTPDWVHLDVYAWEPAGRPGRPRGGAEMSIRALLEFIEGRYA